MRKDYKLINILNPISNFNTFSKYSDSLEKIFKKKSLKNLLYSLNNPTKYDKNYIDEKLMKKEIERDRVTTDKDEEQKNLLEYNYEDYLKSQKEKTIKNSKKEPWSIDINTPRMPKPKRNLDFYKYNPNYNSIQKNVPSFLFVQPTKKKTPLNSKKKIVKNNSNLFLKTIGNDSSKSIIKHSKKYLPLLTSINYKESKTINNESKRNKSLNVYDKNNHTFRFSKYSPRKPFVYKVNNKVTYLKSYDYLAHMNQTIDFKKMTKRNGNNLINTHTLKNPSMCYYNPKYDCVEIETKKVSFNPNSFKKSVKYLRNKKLKKILISHDVNKEYLTIDNSKLVKTESITKLLNL